MIPLEQQIATSTAHRPIRDQISGRVLKNPHEFVKLIALALDFNWPHYTKACWNLELVLEKKIDWLAPYLDDFTLAITHAQTDGSKRSLSKICLFAVRHHMKNPGFLSDGQLHRIIENCFDWTIDPNGKVAAKAYAIRALYPAGKLQPWIYPELKPILEKDYKAHSAAYQAVVREILPKI